MPLIQVKKAEKEADYKFTNFEKGLLRILDPAVIKSSEHDPDILDKLLENERREADPVQSEADVYVAFERRDPKRLLEAVKNLTIKEKNSIVKGITYNLTVLKHTYGIKWAYEKIRTGKETEFKVDKNLFSDEEAQRLQELLDEPDIDLFDLCVRISSMYYN